MGFVKLLAIAAFRFRPVRPRGPHACDLAKYSDWTAQTPSGDPFRSVHPQFPRLSAIARSAPEVVALGAGTNRP